MPGGSYPVASEHPDRLDTWKEVAGHLRRSVRTVQRWEREEGLPVHRHRHDKQGSIYAFRTELDAWWATRGVELDEPKLAAEHVDAGAVTVDSGDPAGGLRARLPFATLALAVATIAFGVLVAFNLSQTTGWQPSPSHQPHRLLIAGFDNHTGEATLSGRLREALQEQLGSSGFAAIVPPDQVEELLRRMRKAPGTFIDGAVAREMSVRDGTTDAFVHGSLDRAGGDFSTTIRILTPDTNAIVASFTAAAPTPALLLDAVRRKLLRGQRALDMRLQHDPNVSELEPVTTSSLRALQLYSQAAKLMDSVPIKPGPAFALLSEATKLDPEFASAHILAAWSLRNANRSQTEILPHAERAFQFVDTTADAERYFILGSYYQLKLEVEKAITSYEALLRLDPTHYWALGNLGRLYRTIGQYDAALRLRARQVEMRPRHFWGPFRLAEALFLKGDLEGAQDYAVRAANIASQLDSTEMQSRTSWLEVLPACRAWLRDDTDEAARLAGALETTLSERRGAEREALTVSVGYIYLALGQRRSAERLFRRLSKDQGRLYHLAVAAASFGDTKTVDEYFAEPAAALNAATLVKGLPTLDPRVLPAATRIVNAWATNFDEAHESLLRGQLALMRGRGAQSRSLLRRSIDLREDRHGTPALAASAGVAKAWAVDGDLPQAAQTLEEASHNRNSSCLWPMSSAHLWLDLRSDLARLYRQIGRDAEAAAIDAHLLSVLRNADSDHPLLAQLNRVEPHARNRHAER